MYTSRPSESSYFTSTDPYSSSSWPTPPGIEVFGSNVGIKRSSAQALYHQNILAAYNTTAQTQAWYSTDPLAKRTRFDTSNLPIYPQRPGEKDCEHYMLTRTCKFGETCKFDHPIWVPEGGIPDWKEVPVSTTTELLPERTSQPDCPFFLKTARCKFGLRCKFNHPKDKVVNSSLIGDSSSSALPERPTEPPCVFYLKTGICKFGATCKFDHPRDVQPAATVQGNGIGDEYAANTTLTPASLHNSKGLPIRPGEVDCLFYLKTGSCKFGASCRYNHPERYVNPAAAAISPPFVPSPVTHLNIGGFTPATSFLQSYAGQTPIVMASTLYPQRPGETECDFYIKTGICKFGDKCRFHHPLDRPTNTMTTTEAYQLNVKLSLAGLPRREGAVHCPYYMKTGTCKYGATCKFDHPPPGEILSKATSAPVGGEAEEDTATEQKSSS
ncbi:RNA metabolism protein [Lithospermum erythrorhizon]|uniref:RNA metabolism protein n=1 Tax=Lithospermum erythrorhizon TaxID=34254 RepID=A0AAV3P0J5_LITER